MTTADLPMGNLTDLESGVRSYSRRISATFTSAQGARLSDLDGNLHLDFLSGCSALNYGHNDPDMAAALIDYVAGGGIAHGLDLQTTARNDFLRSFRELILEPRGFDHLVQFTGPTGTNAVEAAIKLARKVTGRTNVIAFTNAFHGVTSGALAATGNQGHRMAPHVPLVGVTRALYDGYVGPDVDTAALLDQLLSDPSSGIDPPAAILLETVQAEGGLNTASVAWLQTMREIADRHGALLIIDDIQAGCGRTGTFFSFEPADITPDLVVLSKSLSGFGLPMSIVLLRPQLDQWSPGEHNGTFRGNNLAFVTATVALKKFWSDDELTSAVAAKAMTVAGTLETLAATIPGACVKGRGLLLGVETHDPERAGRIATECFERGLILETAGPTDSVVKLLPPLTIAHDELDAGLAILAESVAATALRPTTVPTHEPCYRDLLARALTTHDDVVLLSDGSRRLAAADITARTERLGDDLRLAGAGPETLVALRFEPGVDAILAILAVLSTGAAYLPLDPRHGETRIEQILAATTPDLMLDRRGIKPLVDGPTHRPSGGLDDLAYVISTSGSTGTPKAAMLEQRGLVVHTEAMIELLGLGPGDVVLQTAPPSFDIAVWQCTTPIVAGARTHVADDDQRLDPRELWRVIIDERVTVTQLVPSMIRVLLDSAPRRETLALRHVISTGEALEPAVANRWFEQYPDLPLINLYGPAECSDDVSVHVLTGPVDPTTPVPIGVPFAGAHLRLLDDDGVDVAAGETGQLQVCGSIVGRGYRNDPERTAASFGTTTIDGDTVRFYDTGDLAYRDVDGLLRYVGRQDFQVKVRGNRIELGEIEHVVAELDEVRSCVVTTFGNGGDRLAAHIEVDGRVDAIDRGTMRAHVADRLPTYMVPSAYLGYEQLPLNPNGKVDRSLLRDPSSTDFVAGRGITRSPATPTERALARSWGRLLDLAEVPVNADFFDLGGTSLLAVISIDELSRELGHEIPTRILITGGTVERIAAALDAGVEAPLQDAGGPLATGLVQIQDHPDGTPLFLYPGEAVSALGMVDLGRLVEPNRSVYVFEPARPVDGEQGPSMFTLAQRCREAIATVRPQGPVHLAGFCMGGDVAWEIAHQRARAGEPTASVQLLQTERDGVYPQWPQHMGRLRIAGARIRQRVQFEFATARALGRAQRRSHIRHLVIGKMISKLTLPFERVMHLSGFGARLGLRPSLRLRQHLWALVDRAAYDGWTPQPLECPVTVVRATEQPPLVEPDPLLGWGSTDSPHLSTREVDAFHWTFLHHPAVSTLARVVSDELSRHDETATTPDHDPAT